MPAKTTKAPVFTLGQYGLNLASSPLHVNAGELVGNAQNVAFSKVRAQGGITKRPGMDAVNAVAAGSSILGFQNITLPDTAVPAGGWSGWPSTVPFEFLDNSFAATGPIRYAAPNWTSADVLTQNFGYDGRICSRYGSGYLALSWEGATSASEDGKIYNIVGDVETLVATLAVRGGGYTVTMIEQLFENTGYLWFRVTMRNPLDDSDCWDYTGLKLSDLSTVLLGTAPFAIKNDAGTYPFDLRTAGCCLAPDGYVYALRTSVTGYDGVHFSHIRREIFRTTVAGGGAWASVWQFDHYVMGLYDECNMVTDGTYLYTAIDNADPGPHRVIRSSNGTTWSDRETTEIRQLGLVDGLRLFDERNGAYSDDGGLTFSALDVSDCLASASFLNRGIIIAFARIEDYYVAWAGHNTADDGSTVIRYRRETLVRDDIGKITVGAGPEPHLMLAPLV